MQYIQFGISISLLIASTVGAMSKPSPSSSKLKCNDSITSSQLLTECLASGHGEGSAELRHCVCVGLGFDGDSCTTSCTGLSPSIREAPSIYSTDMATGDRNFDGDPKIQAMVTVPPTNHKHTLHNAAAANVGKGGVDITRLSGSKQKPGQRQRQRRRRTTSAATNPQASTNGMSAVRKIVGGIALGVLVMVV